MSQRVQRYLGGQLRSIGDLSKGLGRRVELERPPVLVRKDEAEVEVLSGLGRELLGRLGGLDPPQNRNRIAIEGDKPALTRLCAFEDDGSRPGGAFCLLGPRRGKGRADGQRASIEIDGIPLQANKLTAPRAS